MGGRKCMQVGRDGMTLLCSREVTCYVGRPRRVGLASRVRKAGKLRGRPTRPTSPCLAPPTRGPAREVLGWCCTRLGILWAKPLWGLAALARAGLRVWGPWLTREPVRPGQCGSVRVEGAETRHLPGISGARANQRSDARDRGAARSGAAPSSSKHSPALGKAGASCARAWSARGTSAHSQACRGVADQR